MSCFWREISIYWCVNDAQKLLHVLFLKMDGKYCQGYVTLISYLNIWLNILSLILGYSLVHIYSFYFYVLCKWQYIEETLTTIIGGVFLLMFTWYQSPLGLAFIDPLASMAIENTSPTLLPFNIMIHMVTIKLSSSSYLLSKNQLLPLLESQELLGHVDGTLAPPQIGRAHVWTPVT